MVKELKVWPISIHRTTLQCWTQAIWNHPLMVKVAKLWPNSIHPISESKGGNTTDIRNQTCPPKEYGFCAPFFPGFLIFVMPVQPKWNQINERKGHESRGCKIITLIFLFPMEHFQQHTKKLPESFYFDITGWGPGIKIFVCMAPFQS